VISEAFRQHLEEFFKEFYQDDSFSLPLIKVHHGPLSALLTKLLNIGALTLRDHIFVSSPTVSASLIVHEIVHVLQYRRVGTIRFLARYLKDYLSGMEVSRCYRSDIRMNAYYSIPWECDARAAEVAYLRWAGKQVN
jgi:hypothetical protein